MINYFLTIFIFSIKNFLKNWGQGVGKGGGETKSFTIKEYAEQEINTKKSSFDIAKKKIIIQNILFLSLKKWKIMLSMKKKTYE